MFFHKPIGDGLSITVTGAAMIGYLPAVAAGLSVLWWIIRIYETRTVQQLIERFFGRS
jgi:hypothetical protein